jgi:mRNA-degrading endonuclease toxin of MazEF toxin-antitoxin module
MGMVKRFEVYLTNLDPTIGVEIQKRRLCLFVPEK